MSYHYVQGKCDVCSQGGILIAKYKNEKKLFLVCDECETRWNNQESFAKGVAMPRENKQLRGDLSDDEISAAGWDKYVIYIEEK
jgi:hypothetical protein